MLRLSVMSKGENSFDFALFHSNFKTTKKKLFYLFVICNILEQANCCLNYSENFYLAFVHFVANLSLCSYS